MANQFPQLDSDAIRNHVLALGRGDVAPTDGPERHFLRVLAGQARAASAGEREWIAYWHEHADDAPEKARPLAPTPEREPVSLVDLAVVATNIGVNIASVEQAAADPLLKQAIEMTTSRSLSDFASDPEGLQGAINTAKGKYFELLVEEKLNQGEAIGNITLAADQKAALAASMNQPGWDIAITDDQQRLVETVQLKATDSVSYIKDTLERYPDIKIVTTSEAVHGSAHGDMVIDSGISNHDIEQVVGHAVGDQSANFIGTFVDTFNPLFPLIFIVATEGFKVSVGKASVEQAFDAATARAKHSVTGGAVGALSYAMGFGWFSFIPAVLAARAGPEGVLELLERTYDGIVDWYAGKVAEAKAKLPETCVRLAAWLTQKARDEGINAVFSPEEIQRVLGPDRCGVDLIDSFTDGWVGYDIYKQHPVVKRYWKERDERLTRELENYLIAEMSKKH